MFTHFDEKGQARMVDVTGKPVTERIAIAEGIVKMKPETLKMILNKKIVKGDVFQVARLAGIMAAKMTPHLIPLCHPLPITSIEIDFEPDEDNSQVKIKTTVKTTAQTGVEMEAMVATSLASLTVYDMCKAVDKEMIIGDIKLVYKAGGKSGEFVRT
ncbi:MULTISPECIES: cyclic pyranopterin monophosphate synthase MoaC [Thermodesulfovibrio]|uniref:Cyclic pyranopterin monophosphate synthase n=2 Tax=Thermodesulfovibrio yellowstonii TaxID=28262 RepID=B5YFM0_THEYD|nr:MULTISPECIES: cyclic pyranopterin monophosphate synthase MoaC [Thermodesulfovibrio]ACI20949.1 molybdenum cofactor biosynthesis protein C [Thermodesulfovibrio yellowstonii DSM 11347]MDI6864880.1 cyclic pyranopterin monophosphate synthase MoaC [Thermodesulfovibrio yellowstonii]GLI53338.1 cyclic pyranopterin monophosphate synthase accessory protein [Thermodesulfovibrio islandicus]